MTQSIAEIKDHDLETAKQLAGKDWHSLTAHEVQKAIVLQRTTGLLSPHVRSVGQDHGYGLCKVGNFTPLH